MGRPVQPPPRGRLVLILAAGLVLSSVAATAACASEASDSLLKADRALAARNLEIGFVAAYGQAAAPDAHKFDAGEPTAIGRDAVLATLAKTTPADFKIEWKPEEAVVANSGELGYTWGHFIARYTNAKGKLETYYGRYLDVWRRQSDGAWKWIADMGTPDPDPAPAPAAG